jgi:hypothetical protein
MRAGAPVWSTPSTDGANDARPPRGRAHGRSDRIGAAAGGVWHRTGGAAAELEIDVVHDVPGVGENLQDHPFAHVSFSADEPIDDGGGRLAGALARLEREYRDEDEAHDLARLARTILGRVRFSPDSGLAAAR